jgi:hypothetical protein
VRAAERLTKYNSICQTKKVRTNNDKRWIQNRQLQGQGRILRFWLRQNDGLQGLRQNDGLQGLRQNDGLQGLRQNDDVVENGYARLIIPLPSGGVRG